MIDINLILTPADVTRLEIAVNAMIDGFYDRIREMQKNKLEMIKRGEWCLAYESEFIAFYDKEVAQQARWKDLLATIKVARRENDPSFKPNPFIDKDWEEK